VIRRTLHRRLAVPRQRSSPPVEGDAAFDELLVRLARLDGGEAGPQPDTPSIPGYRLIEQIARGGMGEVWRAEQREPLRREVALKLIKQGADTRQAVARFEAERQALALMDHPAIAKVLAAGSTDQGLPWFAMEYVRGTTLDEHCDRARFPVRARVELFRQVCAGVQHTHQKAILHRDLKPANVLVTLVDGKPQVKIIDFGVAKPLALPLTERTLQPELGQMVGTPGYMSPEQGAFARQDVDARADVYSLGVMLHQLLSGALPFEVEPPPPSARFRGEGDEVESNAWKRSSTPRVVRHEIAGDLDAIVKKAMAKDRCSRYASAAELSADLENYLERRPVEARTRGGGWRVWSYVVRHRVAVAGAAGLLLLLLQLGFSASVAMQLRRRVDRDSMEVATCK
jgi:serine/threonine protein kinase